MSYGDAVTLAHARCSSAAGTSAPGCSRNRFDIFGLTTVQLAVVALVSIPFVVVDGFGTIDTGVILTVIFTGVGCSAVAFSLSAWAQRTIDAVARPASSTCSSRSSPGSSATRSASGSAWSGTSARR